LSRSLVLALAINLICIAGLLWSTTERLHVRVIVTGDSVTGVVGGATVTAPTGGLDSGKVGLFLIGADPHASISWPPAPGDNSEPAAASFSDWLYRLGAESAWTNVQVTDLASNRQLYPDGASTADTADWRPQFGDWFSHPLGGMTTARPGLVSIGSASWRGYQLDADVLRPRNAAGVLVLSPDGTNGLLFYFRPEDRDVMWFRVVDGQWDGPIASAPFHAFEKSGVASVQDVLRLALGGYPGVVAIVALSLVLAAIECRTLRKSYDVVPDTSVSVTGFATADPSQPAGLVMPATDPLPVQSERQAGAVRSFRPGPSVFGLVRELLLPSTDAVVSVHATPATDRSTAAGSGSSALSMQADGASVSHEWKSDSVRRAVGLTRRAPTVLALVLTGAALASTLYIADVVLERMPHVQDSVAYLFQAKTFALGRLWVPVPLHPDFFKHEFIVMDHGRWFSKYPPGWPMLLALGVLAGAPWVVNPICAALSIYLIYKLGAEIYRPRVGLLAAGLGTVSPFFLFLSGSMMSHPSGLLFALLFAWCFWRATRSNRPIWPAAASGLAFGVGFLIRPYTMIAIALPFALSSVLQISRRPRDGLLRYLPAVAAAVPFGVAFLAYNAYFTGNPFYPPQQLWWSFDSVGFGPQHGPWGFTPVDALNNTSRNLLELLEHTYGWPEFLTLSFAMLPFVTGRFRMWDWLFAASFVALVAGYALWWADGIMYGPRFYYEGLGFLLLLTARGVDEAASLIERRTRTLVARARLLAPMVIYAFVAALVAFNFTYYFPGQWQLYHGYNYVNRSKLDAVERAGIHHALVFADVGQWYEWWEYGMVFSANDPLLQGDVIFARDLGTTEDKKLLADFPGRAYYRLNGTQLTPFENSPTP
jgi:hypothetical protein